MVQVGKQDMVDMFPEIIVNTGILITLELDVLCMKQRKLEKVNVCLVYRQECSRVPYWAVWEPLPL